MYTTIESWMHLKIQSYIVYEKTKQIYTTTSIRKHSEARFAYGGYGC